MKGRYRFLLLFSALVVVACTKEWTGRRQASGRFKPGLPEDKAVFASEWTTISQWQKDNKGFYAEQTVTQAKEGGKVLLFARKLWAADQSEDTTDIPLQLPLQFLPYTDQPGLTETWQYEMNKDTLRVNLEVLGVEEAVPRDVAVRYLIVPQPMWDELTTAVPDMEALPYDDLIAKLEVKP